MLVGGLSPYPPIPLLQGLLGVGCSLPGEMPCHLKLLSMPRDLSWPGSSYLQEMGTVHVQIWDWLRETLEEWCSLVPRPTACICSPSCEDVKKQIATGGPIDRLHTNILCGRHANSTRQPQVQTDPKSLHQSPETGEGFSPFPPVPRVRS